MMLPDDVFAAFLAGGTPSGFPDIAQSFEPALLANPKTIISTAKITSALGAAGISFKRQNPTSAEAMATTSKGGPIDKDKLKCHYCKKKGHFQADCRRKKKDDDEKKSPTVKEVEVEKVDTADVDVGLMGCVETCQIEVLQIGTNVTRWTVIFDTGATHHVFNDQRYFSKIRQIKPLAIKMANGSSSSFITSIGTARI